MKYNNILFWTGFYSGLGLGVLVGTFMTLTMIF